MWATFKHSWTQRKRTTWLKYIWGVVLRSMPSHQSLRLDAGTEALRAIAIVAALIVTALFPGIFASFEKPEDLKFGYGQEDVRMYLRAGCASGVVLASGAIVAALAVQIAIATKSVDSNVALSSYQLNVGYLLSLYLLLLAVANTLVVVAFGAAAFTSLRASAWLYLMISIIGVCIVVLFYIYCILPAIRLQWLRSKHAYEKHKGREELAQQIEERVRAEMSSQAQGATTAGSADVRTAV